MDQLKKPLILIVDDTPQNIQVLGNILYEKGYNISISSSGVHALQSINKQAPDLILLDIQMPEMDGYEVCKTLKSNYKTKDIPIIFLTSVTDSENILLGFELGAVDYITKPFNIAELTARVATHIELKISKDKLVELNATKDKFFSIIAHDLKNPFNQLMGFSKLLMGNCKKYDIETIEEYVSYIHISSKKNYELLENLLNWARLQMGKFEIRKEKFNICSLINIATDGLQCIAIDKGVEIIVSPNKKAEAFFDIEMFKLIIRNFTTNAIKFSNKEGKVILKISEFNEKYYKISVEDTGIGISENDLSKLFRINISQTTLGTSSEKGTGLGLILCKDFIEKNDCQIFVESEINKGSVFSFT
ncbi:MAG: hypothetical protein A2309_11085, partial [Bacteroidetes bacterium RIFOXYB2_FULL_35_7]